MCKKLKKGMQESIDKILEKHNIETKMFGHPIEDFDIEDMSITQMVSMKKLLKKKIESYGG